MTSPSQSNLSISSIQIPDNAKIADLAIIGSGPAGLTAAIYAARANLSTVVLEKELIGGILPTIPLIENFPSFIGEGSELTLAIKNQAKSFGARFLYAECKSITPVKNPSINNPTSQLFYIATDRDPLFAHTVLIATGSNPRKLPNPPNSLPIHYCATCDGPLYQGKDILVLGGGNSAVSETIFLARFARHITLVSREQLSAEPMLINRLRKINNLTILEHSSLTQELISSHSALFVLIGRIPATDFLPSELLDQDGYIITDAQNMTNIQGIFAAGDVRAGLEKQAIIAAGDGAAAAISIEKYLNYKEQ